MLLYSPTQTDHSTNVNARQKHAQKDCAVKPGVRLAGRYSFVENQTISCQKEPLKQYCVNACVCVAPPDRESLPTSPSGLSLVAKVHQPLTSVARATKEDVVHPASDHRAPHTLRHHGTN